MGMILVVVASLAGIPFVSEGVSSHIIVSPGDAIPSEHLAARELQTYLKSVTGVELPIFLETDAPDSPRRIDVGPTRRFLAAYPDASPDALKHDGIVLKTSGESLFLSGARPRGTLYAVYTFLEDVAGCRWWTPTESSIPSIETIEIPELDTVYIPKLRYREAFYRDAVNEAFAVRNRLNGNHMQISQEWGGHYSILGWCHTFFPLLPPETYFEAHPEWYSEIDGQRAHAHAQLCLTNDAMRAELVKNALEWIAKTPDAGMISISQNDWYGRCQCKACAAVEAEEGAPSGLLLRFVNAVAEEIETLYPDMLVETLAYQYTRQAPLITRPRQNVIIRLCSIECDFAQPLETGPRNVDFKQDMEAWSAVAPNLFVWDYVTNFTNYILPHPNMRSLAPNIRFFVRNNTIGLFEQGDFGSGCSDFVELRTWVLSKLMWNPDLDEDALIREFLEGYYGPAATPLEAYIAFLNETIAKADVPLRCFMSDAHEWLKPDGLSHAWGLFEEAQRAVAGDSLLEARVRRARLPLDHAVLLEYHKARRKARIQGLPNPLTVDPVALCEDFIASANRFEVGWHAEGRPFSDYAPLLQRRFRTSVTAPSPWSDLPESEWLDIQDNEFTLFMLGDKVTIADDPEASDRSAARMPATHNEWAVQFPVSDDLAETGPWQCIVLLRAELQEGTGAPEGFIGLYDQETRAEFARIPVDTAQAVKGYAIHDLGAHPLRKGMYLWVAPEPKEGTGGALWVDRIVLLKIKPEVANAQ